MRNTDSVVVVIEEAVPIPPRRHKGERSPRGLSHAIGASATILVHLLISTPLILGVAAHKPRPQPIAGPGSVAWASKGSQLESMVLLDLSGLTADPPDEQALPDIKSEGVELEDSKLALASLEPAPPPVIEFEDAEEAETANVAAGDPAGAAALFGRYMNQIAGRIERTWMRPRAPIDGGRFDCQARISQDRRGRVLSIELQDCSDDSTWRESLTSAILRASPLSAPSEQWLFSENITLRFSADEYTDGKTPVYLYEPEAKHVAQKVAPAGIQGELDGPGDYELTSEGGEIRWIKKR